jgi:hypothetical protein
MHDVRVLAPPYRLEDRPVDGLPPLGAVVLAWTDSVQRLRAEVAAVLARAPWCVPVLVVDDGVAAPEMLSAIHDVPGQPAFIRDPLNGAVLPALVLSAVRSRRPPTGRELAEYVVRRTGRVALRSALETLLSPGPAARAEPTTRLGPARTVRDRLRRFGPLSPRCWRRVGTLARVPGMAPGDGVDVIAWRAGVCPRSLRVWCRRFLGISLRALRERVGWEWVMESALRLAGYVPDPALPRPEVVRAPLARPTAPPPALPPVFAPPLPAGRAAGVVRDRRA